MSLLLYIHRETIIKKIAKIIVRYASQYACRTYGDVAEMSEGPCQRSVQGPPTTGENPSPATGHVIIDAVIRAAAIDKVVDEDDATKA